MYAMTYHAPVGDITLVENNGALTHLSYSASPKLPQDVLMQSTPLLKEAARQLDEYFAKKRQTFDLPLNPVGTAFQQKVWAALQEIPYGHTASYKDIAVRIGNPKACRAVGMANNKNPIAIVIPCHRVIGSGGKLVGYAGGLHVKQKLLEVEGLTLL